MRNNKGLEAIVPWIVLWVVAATSPDVSAEPPVVLGELHHEALAEGLPKERTDFGIGFNYFFDELKYKGLRVNFEIYRPVYQDVNGTQLEMEQIIRGNLMYAF